MAGDDYNLQLNNDKLPFTNSHRRECFNLTIIDDGRPENDEKFSIHVERHSKVAHSIDIDFFPSMLTLNIMDNDG